MKRLCLVDFNMSVLGGVEKVTSVMANELSKYYKVYIVSITNGKNGCKYKIDNKIEISSLANGELRLRDAIVKGNIELRKYFNDNKIDVAILMGTYAAIAGIFTKPFTKTKIIFSDHGALINQWDDKKITLIRYIVSKFSDKTITLTNKSREDYIKKFNISPQKIECIYNSIDTEMYKYTKEYDCKSKKILTIGRISEEKGFDLLIKVAKIILKKHPDWEWHIFGEGEKFEDIKAEIKKNKLSNNLFLKGSIECAYDIYNNYSIFVLTSYREGLPLVLLEAKSSKLPSISFDIITGPNEIITDNVNGFLIKPYNIEEMAEKIELLIQSEDLRKNFSDNSIIDISKFENNTIMEQWKKIIDMI